jgi:Fic family protein
LILSKFNAAFEYIPIESVIKRRQGVYYRVLEQCDKKGDSTSFIEFSLETIRDALKEFLSHLKPEPETPESRLNIVYAEFEKREFSRKHYIEFFKTISTATASRDLAYGVDEGLLEKSGAKATTKYRFRKVLKLYGV